MAKTKQVKPKPRIAWAVEMSGAVDILTVAATRKECKERFMLSYVSGARTDIVFNHGETWAVRKVRIEVVE